MIDKCYEYSLDRIRNGNKENPIIIQMILVHLLKLRGKVQLSNQGLNLDCCKDVVTRLFFIKKKSLLYQKKKEFEF